MIAAGARGVVRRRGRGRALPVPGRARDLAEAIPARRRLPRRVVIADGHHRYETALAYQEEQRAAGGRRPRRRPDHDAGGGAGRRPAVVRPIHRVLRGRSPDFRARLARPSATSCRPAPTRPRACGSSWPRWTGPGRMGLVDRQGLALLKPRRDVLGRGPGRPARDRCGTSTPPSSTLMLDRLGRTAAGASTTATSALTVAAMVAKGAADAAVLLRPVTVAQIDDRGRGRRCGCRRRRRSSSPKPLTGLVFRSLDLRLARSPQVDFGAGRLAGPAGVEAGGGGLLGGHGAAGRVPADQLAGGPVVGVGPGDDQGGVGVGRARSPAGARRHPVRGCCAARPGSPRAAPGRPAGSG